MTIKKIKRGCCGWNAFIIFRDVIELKFDWIRQRILLAADFYSRSLNLAVELYDGHIDEIHTTNANYQAQNLIINHSF